MKTEHTEVLGW